MNLQCESILDPLRVILVNPLGPAAKLLIVKILSGAVFGDNQMVDLCLLVYANEIDSAEDLKLEIESCAFSCNNSIEISSDLPRYLFDFLTTKHHRYLLTKSYTYLIIEKWILTFTSFIVKYLPTYLARFIFIENSFLKSISDGDVFCFLTNFPNPNIFVQSPKAYEEHYDDLYLIIKLAQNVTVMADDISMNIKSNKKQTANKIVKRKPIFMADGLIVIDVLKSLSTNIPADVLFCPTPLTAIAKSILGEHLNVQCNNINDTIVWAANDKVFHVEVQKPLIIHDVGSDESQCDWGMISKDLLDSLNLDRSQFNASWLRREFINKVSSSASKNPYGCIYKASEFAKTLRDIWLARSGKDGMKVYSNIGVISDGSVGTLKGYPYVLPLVLSNDSWTVDKRFEKNTHLMQDIKKINKEAEQCHQLLMSFCNRVLIDTVINQGSTPDSSFMD